MKLNTRIWLPLAVLALGGAVGAAAQAQDRQELREALAAEERSAEDKARDAESKPIEVLEFLGVESGMTALDIIAAGGYWTEVLSAAVGPDGKVYKQNPEFFLQRGGDEFLQNEQAMVERLGNVEPIHGDLQDSSLSEDVDVAITSMNYHDVYNRGGDEAGTAFLEGVYDVLKPGGVLGVIDHVGIAGQDNAAFHRVEVDAVKRTLEAAGFTVEEESDLLANPEDDHTRNIRDDSLDRTDKMLIRARKPM
ncbi:MAG: class I SAM-dependent methyltransferase [Gammaproteobacteria bacterium]|nr:class I SAM-dependent methyltransferase [Gammaproteobacteria bacterium]